MGTQHNTARKNRFKRSPRKRRNHKHVQRENRELVDLFNNSMVLSTKSEQTRPHSVGELSKLFSYLYDDGT